MRLAELKNWVGEVVILDMVSGVQLTTKIEEVSIDGYVLIGKPLVFQISVEPKNPNIPPSPDNPLEQHVRHASYGHPLFEVADSTPISPEHIIMVHKTHPDMEKVYLQSTSGIQLADASALAQLDAANQPPR